MIEAIALPKKVVDADWRDDIDETVMEYEAYDNEKEYVAPKEVDAQTIERIKKINLTRGNKILGIFDKK